MTNFHQFAVNAPNAGDQVGVDRKEDANGHQGNLGRFINAHP